MPDASARTIYRKLVSFVKRLDKATGYRIGDAARRLTNVNSLRYWDAYLAKRGDSWRIFPYEFLLEELPKDRKFSLLDVGCALGEGCEFLKKHFPDAEVYGADLSCVGIEKAKARSRCQDYFCLDISKVDPPRRYDFITLIHIIEHFNDPFAVLDRCLRFADEAVYISTPYGEKFEDPRLYWKGEHRYLFDEKTFQKYHGTVLKITDRIPETKARHILYKITPK